MKLAILFGTRPEIIKLSQLMLLAKENPDIEPIYVHTGQHYSYSMSQEFFEELNLPKIDINLEIGSRSHAHQTAEIMIKLEDFFVSKKPDMIIALGDTNSVLAASLAALKLHIPFGHVESGLRSFDRTMPEEINRIIADQISNYCFTPTKTAVKNLENSETPKENIHYVGNSIVETTQRSLEIAKEKSKILEKLNLEKENYIVVTAHRAESVDTKERLIAIIEALEQINLPIIFSLHPRTEAKLKEFNLLGRIEKDKKIKLIEPLGYIDFLWLCANAKFCITDSGGIQEESTIYKKPVLVIRNNTERPEIIGTFGKLVGYDTKKIVESSNDIINNYENLIKKLKKTDSPFGDGRASERILNILFKDFKK